MSAVQEALVSISLASLAVRDGDTREFEGMTNKAIHLLICAPIYDRYNLFTNVVLFIPKFSNTSS